MGFKENMRNLRKKKGATLEYVAKYVGTSRQTIQKYESGVVVNIPIEKIEKIAEALGTTPAYLVGWADRPERPDDGKNTHTSGNAHNAKADNDDHYAHTDQCVYTGNYDTRQRYISAYGTLVGEKANSDGGRLTLNENMRDYASVPLGVQYDFTLTCQGDGLMEARILDGDTVYIREQPDVENGEIAAVMIGGETTLKRVYKSDSQLVLISANLRYAPLVYTGTSQGKVRIMGKAVAFTSMVRSV